MPLSVRHNCQCCSVTAARVLHDLLNQAFSVHLCEYSRIGTLRQLQTYIPYITYPLPSSKMLFSKVISRLLKWSLALQRVNRVVVLVFKKGVPPLLTSIWEGEQCFINMISNFKMRLCVSFRALNNYDFTVDIYSSVPIC